MLDCIVLLGNLSQTLQNVIPIIPIDILIYILERIEINDEKGANEEENNNVEDHLNQTIESNNFDVLKSIFADILDVILFFLKNNLIIQILIVLWITLK